MLFWSEIYSKHLKKKKKKKMLTGDDIVAD